MKITEEYLVEKGFRKKGECGRSPVYIKQPEGYYYGIQFTLGNYPETNPNSGTVALWKPEEIVFGVKEMKSGEVEEIRTYEGEESWGIAWHVTTPERLEAIYESLTREKL